VAAITHPRHARRAPGPRALSFANYLSCGPKPMSHDNPIRPSESLRHVKYEIRGRLARRAQELERQGYEIVPLNIGNPGAFGFRTPETMRLAMIENMAVAEGYCHQKGIFPAREAVVMQQQMRGVTGVSAEEVFIGNGVSELIDLALRALLNAGDEVLIPSPDYPLWSAAVTLNGGKAVYYACRPENDFVPDPEEIAALVTRRTRAIVVINPNNPTGAVYPRAVCEAIARLAERKGLVVLSDEIYDQMTYDGAESIPMATLVKDTLCCTMSGLSKIYRACGYRVGWAAFSGNLRGAADYLSALELLSSLRLCSNVPAQWAVQTALGGYQSVKELLAPGGRLYESRRAILDSVAASRFLQLAPPKGSMYAFVRVKTEELPDFDDQQFALDLLEQKHVLLAPGTSFNVPYRDHFRTTLLPEAALLKKVFGRIEELLSSYAGRPAGEATPAGQRVVRAEARFK
jgi:alanine-synthesizing transaminase